MVKRRVAAIDLFCGAGGLSHGFLLEGINVVAGIDNDDACRYAFEKNNKATFLKRDIRDVEPEELVRLFPDGHLRILAGCAPCQPFSTYTQGRRDKRDQKWGLLYEFGRLVEKFRPEIVTMENVKQLSRYEIYSDFLHLLEVCEYHVTDYVVDCTKYGIPQTRHRLVLFASKFSPIALKPPINGLPLKTVRDAIGHLEPIEAGGISKVDQLHCSQNLSEINLKRIRASKPGGTWRDWENGLIVNCHQKTEGQTYPSVYGRMEWDKPSPTITTNCFNYGSGRFGHPEQDRAISLREAALLQTFPDYYDFFRSDLQVSFKKAGMLIGNAVPVELGRLIARSIVYHFKENGLSARSLSKNRKNRKMNSPTQSYPKKGPRRTPKPSSENARRRMENQRQRDTKPELAIRSILFRMGFGYRVDYKVLKGVRRRADIAFIGPLLAVFIDGCFWHGCPDHGTWPKSNADFWRNKIMTNKERDADTDQRLEEAGWKVVRVWEHEDPLWAAEKIARIVRGG